MPLSTWKISTVDTPGSAQKFGTADINKLFRFLNGETDVGNAEIDSDIAILQDRLKLRDSTNTNDVTLNADLDQSSNVVLSIPLLTANDTIMTVGGSQAFAGKTFDITANTLTDTTSPNHGDILKYDSTVGKYVKLPRGSASQVLQVDSTGADVIWGSASGASGTWNPATAETLTNKNINATNNTITDSSTAAGDLFKSNATKFVRMARGSVNQVLQSTSGDLTWGLVGDANITTHTTTKISTTSKSLLNSSIVYKDQNNDLGTFYQDLGGITTPTAPAAGKARLFVNSATGQLTIKKSDGSVVSLEASSYSPSNAETLTNKIIDAATNTLTNVMISPIVRKVGAWSGISTTAGTGFFNGFLRTGGTGSFTLNRDSTVGSYTTFTTAGSNTDKATMTTNDTYTAMSLNPTFQCKFRLPAIPPGERVDLGFSSNPTSDPGNSDYLASKSGATLSFGAGRNNSVNEGSFFISTNNGGSASTWTGPLATIVANTVYTIWIQLDNANNRVRYSLNGGTIGNITTAVPAAATLLGIVWGIQATTSSSKSMDVFAVDATSDK